MRKRVAMHMIQLLFAIIAANSLGFLQTTYEKTLDVNGMANCATGSPFDTYEVPDPSPSSQCIPLIAECSSQCRMRPNCTNFNVRTASRTCEFYSYLPRLCCCARDCIHFQDTAKHCSNPGCGLGEKIVNYNLSGAIVPLLYINNSFIIMQRLMGDLDFHRMFDEYKVGFGDLAACDFWIGNEIMHRLTTQKGISYHLHVDIQAYPEGKWYYADYSTFWIDSEATNYTLHVTGYSGTAGNSLNYPKAVVDHNGQMFSTPDRDNDQGPNKNCAAQYSNGWWYSGCFYACLTCLYDDDKFAWATLSEMRLQAARMTIRPNVTLRIT